MQHIWNGKGRELQAESASVPLISVYSGICQNSPYAAQASTRAALQLIAAYLFLLVLIWMPLIGSTLISSIIVFYWTMRVRPHVHWGQQGEVRDWADTWPTIMASAVGLADHSEPLKPTTVLVVNMH